MKLQKKVLKLSLSLFILFSIISCASLPENKSEVSEKTSFDYKTIKIDENLDYLTTKIEYPEFYSFPELNKRIKNTVENEWKSFRSYSQASWNEINSLNNSENGNKYPPFEFNTSFQVSSSGDIISVLINNYIFSGGAHGNTTLITLNYDSQNSRYLDIKDVSGMSYNQLSEICLQKLTKVLIDDNKDITTPSEIMDMKEMINSGAFPQAGNFEIFTIKNKSLTVYFEPYSVAPYVYGIQTVIIPLK